MGDFMIRFHQKVLPTVAIGYSPCAGETGKIRKKGGAERMCRCLLLTNMTVLQPEEKSHAKPESTRNGKGSATPWV
jgi:hypothetical protein